MAASGKFTDKEVFEVYRAAYTIPIPWEEILDDDFNHWMNVFEKSTNCSKSLVIPSLLSITSCLSGPGSRVKTRHVHGFSTSLNHFLMAVCDPGGGKSLTYQRIMEPVFDRLIEKHGLNIQIDNYTTAGIQNHQIKNQGYGIITSDEGHRFLSSVTLKQCKGEGERALLCKLWGGRGDTNIMANGSRGFSKTSMSTCLFIQPDPLITELANVQGHDGLMDRFLMFVAKPVFNNTTVIREHSQILHQMPLHSFEDIMMDIYEEHKSGITYTLSEDAQKTYDEMVDCYAEFMNNKYGDHINDEDKENDVPLDPSQDTFSPIFTSSKDTLYILRLATILHILQSKVSSKLNFQTRNNGEISNEIPAEIPYIRIQQAKKLYNAISQQKANIMQIFNTYRATPTPKPVRRMKSFKHRIIRAISKLPGPAIYTRDIQKNIRGCLADSLIMELQSLEKDGFGTLKSLSAAGKKTKHVFCKIHPSCIDTDIGNHSDIIQSSGIHLAEYTNNFAKIDKMDEALNNICKNYHPQMEMIINLLK